MVCARISKRVKLKKERKERSVGEEGRDGFEGERAREEREREEERANSLYLEPEKKRAKAKSGPCILSTCFDVRVQADPVVFEAGGDEESAATRRVDESGNETGTRSSTDHLHRVQDQRYTHLHSKDTVNSAGTFQIPAIPSESENKNPKLTSYSLLLVCSLPPPKHSQSVRPMPNSMHR